MYRVYKALYGKSISHTVLPATWPILLQWVGKLQPYFPRNPKEHALP